jgi:hypothetical protein
MKKAVRLMVDLGSPTMFDRVTGSGQEQEERAQGRFPLVLQLVRNRGNYRV